VVVEALVAELVAAGVARGVVVVPLPAVVAGEVVWPVGPAESDVELVHEVDDPGFTVKGAVWAVKPVLSTRVRPMDVPDAMLHIQVTEVLFCCPKFSREAEVGLPPGRMLRK